MANLSFVDQLDERQLEYAEKIATKAKEMGIPAKLAVAIAYQESRLNPDAPRGSSGEFGIMQVMPETGRGMGYKIEDLRDPEKNIEAGLKYLKQNLDAFGGDSKLATIGYNAGTNSPFFSGGELPETTKQYLKSVNGFGAFAEASAPQEDLVPVAAPAAPEASEVSDTSGASSGERFLGGALGAGVGALASGAQGVSNVRTGIAATRAGAEETARIAAQRSAGVMPTPPGAPPAPSQSVMRQPIPSGGPDGGRLAAGQTGNMPFNYAKAAGLTDIEAGRAVDMTKQAGGVHDLTSQRREGLNRIQGLFPSETYVENPRYGGIMTPNQGVGGGPRESFSMKAPVAAGPDVPLAQPGGLSKLPPRQPISTAPMAFKSASGLDMVTDMFKGMIKPIGTAMQTVGKYVLPPLGGLSAGLDVAELAHEYDKPEAQRDYTKMGLKAASAIGGGLSMFPPTAAVGIPLSLGATAAQAYRENPDFLNQMRNRIGEMESSDPMGFIP